MPKRFELLVFDWDGTLMDSAAVIVSSIQAACRDLDLPVPDKDAASHIIGLGLNEAMQALLPDLDAADYGRMVDRYRFHYLGRDAEIPLFSGVEESLRDLAEAGFMLAVATGKSRTGLDRALGYTGLGERFHATRCADECFSKPHPQMLLELMDELGVAAEQTLMIGDTTHDLLMAQNANVAAVGVGYGAHPRENLEALSPLECFSDYAGLHDWLAAHA
jgi:phosphoglycolate phosphatase